MELIIIKNDGILNTGISTWYDLEIFHTFVKFYVATTSIWNVQISISRSNYFAEIFPEIDYINDS